MIVKAKDLKVGDKLGLLTISKIIPLLYHTRVCYNESPYYAEYLHDAEVAIHREPLIMKRDGSMEPFSKEKLKRSIYKAILDLPESEWDFSRVQQIVDDIHSFGYTYTNWVRLYIEGNTKWNWAKSYASYNKQRRNMQPQM